MDMKIKAEAITAMELAHKIGPLLAGKAPEIQGATLAQLFAMWLAGHQDPNPENDDSELNKFREEAIGLWLKTVRKLLPMEHKIVKDKMRGMRH
jgi:hypothetical protein